MAQAVARALEEADPDNAAAYAANAAAFNEEMEALVEEVAGTLDGLERRGFIVFHDAYQYFEARFDIPAAGSIALHDGDSPSPARMADIRARIHDADVACVFAEPQFQPRLIETAIEGTEARRGSLDPLGEALEPGPDLYSALIRGLADDLAECLDPS
jgi:zinc transport system substrate-binding protein